MEALGEIAKAKLQAILPAVLCSEIEDNFFNISGRFVSLGEKLLAYSLSVTTNLVLISGKKANRLAEDFQSALESGSNFLM
jgi:hypothetical protein